MTDSTARAERIDLSSSEPAFYTWEVAQKPVAVRLPLPLIDRLESEAVENFRSLTSRGSEIGGLLLGSVAPGNPAVVTLADYELIACDYNRGPLYRLSDSDLGRFEHAIEKYGSGSGPRVIGYFRSQTRKGLSLDAEDISFFEPRFLEPQHFVLLIRPFATKASTAGIFIRENGRIGGESSYLEFPFRSSELTATQQNGDKGPSAPAVSSATAVAPPAPTSHRQTSRAQIVPIASRREITLPEPVSSPLPAAPIAAGRVEAPPTPPLKGEAAVPAADVEKVITSPAPVEPETKKLEVKEQQVNEQTRVAESALFAELEPADPAKNKKLRLIVAAAVGMLVLVGGTLVVYPMLHNRLSPRPAIVQQDSSPLSLRVERTTGGMQLSWNRDLPAIQGATRVMLSITDGDRHESILLDPNQVRTGSILYPPITQDVSFQLEVTDPHQTKTTSESLRVLDPRPSPLNDPSDPSAKAAAKAATPGATTAEPTAAAAESKPQEEAAAPKSTTPLKPFNTQSLGQRLRPVNTADLPDAPAIARPNATAAGSLPGIVTSQPSLPALPKSPASAANTTTPGNSAAGAESGGQLKPAEVITRVNPEYSKLARQAGASGVVELEATIGVDGKVKNPHVLKGNAMLQRAAMDAILQWRYKPAMLNGKAVESPVEIKLNFVGHN